jgi:hypothetical protein
MNFTVSLTPFASKSGDEALGVDTFFVFLRFFRKRQFNLTHICTKLDFPQECYLKLDNSSFQFDRNYADGSIQVTSTRDKEKINFEFNITFTRDLLKQKVKVEVLGAVDNNDKSFSQKLVDFTVDMCKLHSGVSIVKLPLMATYLESIRMNLSCPIPRDTPIVLANATYDDRFFPPFPDERKFVFKFISTAVVRKNKGWVNLVSGIIHFRFQKKLSLG